MRYAFIRDDTGQVINLFELIEPQNFTSPLAGHSFVIATSSAAVVGGVWTGSVFLPPDTPWQPNPPDIDVALLLQVDNHNFPKVPAVGSVTPSPVAAAGLVGTSALAARADHVHAVASIAPNSSPGRSLNTTFKPSATKQVLCIYGVQITCTASLAGGANGRVRLLSDAASPPTTIRAEIQNQNSVSLAIALTAVNGQTGLLMYLCPADHNIRLETNNTTGTPAFTLISQCEIPLG